MMEASNTGSPMVLHLILPATQVNEAVDVLLSETPKLFFSVTDIQGYGQPQERLTVREQVAGYQKKAQIQIECDGDRLTSILHELKQAMPSSTVSFRVLPVLECGQL